MKFPVKVVKLDDRARLPEKGTENAAAYDVGVLLPSTEALIIGPGEVISINTGLSFEMPVGMAMLVLPRSGVASKRRLRPVNTPGLIDPDYRGELIIALENCGSTSRFICHGERIAQIMFVPYLEPVFQVVDELTPTTRGEGGFGSTGN